MTTYYYGDIEFGNFVKDSDRYPLAVIHNVKVVKEFDDPRQAWDYYVNANGEFDAYVSTEGVNEFDEKYELVFKRQA